MFHVTCFMKLVIVESPTKAKTIQRFLSDNFLVKSSYGHVRDLPKKEMGIDIEHNFEPRYIIPAKARTKVSELKKLSAKSKEVILATDEDREGEAISWHLAQALQLGKSEIRNPLSLARNLFKSEKNSPPGADPPSAEKFKIQNSKPYHRIVFHEITKSAIENALKNPREIDINLVDAQQARRILDRLVGYELSPFLWKKMRRGLSAGRVQSIALRFIVEREREIEKFREEEFWNIKARLRKEGATEEFEASLAEKNGEKIEKITETKVFAGVYRNKKTSISSTKESENIKADLEESSYSIKSVDRKETQGFPPPPLTTSTLQQAAIGRLGFSAKQTMVVAQKLYEEGHITYMRTDSFNLSQESLASAQKTIQKEFGAEYALPSPRFFKNKSKGAQEAHEAIRPTHPEKIPDELKATLDPNQHKLYKLIWGRVIASQMTPAIFDSLQIEIEAKNEKTKNSYLLRAGGSVVKFDGYLKAYEKRNLGETGLIPEMKEKEPLTLSRIETEQKFTAAPPRYNEASLVKTLEENGIGRPSTYAPIISTIIERQYIDKDESRRLFPLEIGALVNDLLVEHFPRIVDVKFTATVEENLDEIAEGKREWAPVISEFYGPFHKNLLEKMEKVKKEDILEKLDRQCPECGGDLIMKFGRFGKFIACANFPKCKYTEKTEEEKKIDGAHAGVGCEKCGAPMTVKRGRFGAFLGCSNYPNCKNIKKIEKKLGIVCPKCVEGDIVELRSKKGRNFYGCSRYPNCDFALWNKPTGQKCPKCNSLLVEMPKGKTKCSNKECNKK
ncbi:type I DNA topoisomerase [Candidatus Falkowbacteria bacterium]|nr:type I DNA topoisomerase [Candidatus Falkowbacteria bacterium]